MIEERHVSCLGIHRIKVPEEWIAYSHDLLITKWIRNLSRDSFPLFTITNKQSNQIYNWQGLF